MRLEQERDGEIQRGKELKSMLDRAGRLLDIQNDAAEQKFLSLQLVTRRQEEQISSLYEEIEVEKTSYSQTWKDNSGKSNANYPLSYSEGIFA